MNDTVDLTRKIQLMEIDILNEFKKICHKYRLRYFAIGGTCLGAIRHKGFIPWDDDIDIVMPYGDYCIFRSIAKNELKKPYALFDPFEHKQCSISFLKVHNINTTFVEQECIAYTDRYTGVFIDIMPMYSLPNNPNDLRKCVKMCNWGLRKNAAVRFSYKEQPSLMGKFLWGITFFKRKTQDFNFYLKQIENELGKYNFDNAQNVLFGFRQIPFRHNPAYTYKVVFPKSIFANFLEVPFENTSIRIPYGYDQYLTMDFGNYMQLPPKNKQVSVHPAAIIDLTKSYEDYIRGGSL